jgi:hypothetical protein
MGADLPKDTMEKRSVLYSEKATEEELNSLADRYVAAERFGEALEFLEKTRDEGRLETIRREAAERGDTFLLLRVDHLRREPLPTEVWLTAAERATELGKYHDAYRALLKASREEEAEALRADHLPEYQPFKPEGK